MKKKLLTVISGLIFVLVFPNLAFAKTYMVSSPNPTPTPMAEVNSFELFWPMVAGRTMGDSFYFLKSIKEKIRGSLIFGPAEKADYQVFLAAKRALEVESLLGKGKDNLALATLGKESSLLDAALSNLDKAKSGGESALAGLTEIEKRLENIKKLNDWLLSRASPDVKAKLEEDNSKIKVLGDSIAR